MTRDDSNNEWLSNECGCNNVPGVLGTNAAAMEWQPGTEIEFGKFFCNGVWGIGAGYWGLYSDQQEASVLRSSLSGGTLMSPLDFDSLELPLDNIGDWYDAALVHRVRRNYEFHNVELNAFWRPCGGCGMSGGCGDCSTGGCGTCCSSPFTFTALAGVRFFRMDEGFQFSSDDVDTTFDGDTGELHYNIDTENNLVGFQLGCRGDYCVGCRWSFFGDVKFGVFGNYMTQRQSLRDGTGALAYVDGGANDGELYNLNSHDSDVAMMGELRLGVGYQICRCWRATLGWRAVGVSGVALTTNQIPHDFSNLDSASTIHRNGNLILHGMQAGLEANF
jgi:hypothetical protein